MRKTNIEIRNTNEKNLKQKRWPKNTITAGRRHTIGLKSDGTVTAAGDNKYGQCNVSGWLDIVQVTAGNVHMATNTGNCNRYRQCNVSDWHGGCGGSK